MRKYITHSRKETPWNENSLTILQKYLSETTLRNYYIKHPNLEQPEKTIKETDVFNSFEITECRYCYSKCIIKYGKNSKGIRKFYCKTCKRYFVVTTNTIFDNHKLPLSEWVDFCIGIFTNISFSGVSRFNRNSYNTTKYWVNKLELLLRNYQENILLENKIQIDETYYKLVKRDLEKIEGKEMRGLSTNQICIGIGRDKKKIYCKVEKLGKPSSESTWNTFSNHIKKGSELIHDGDKSHVKLIKELDLISIVYKAKDLKGLADKDNPLDPINKACNDLKYFLHAHKGFNRNTLQGLLDLHVFIHNTPKDNLLKIELLVEYAMENNALLRFR